MTVCEKIILKHLEGLADTQLADRGPILKIGMPILRDCRNALKMYWNKIPAQELTAKFPFPSFVS